MKGTANNSINARGAGSRNFESGMSIDLLDLKHEAIA
jgi:hypothetical protein